MRSSAAAAFEMNSIKFVESLFVVVLTGMMAACGGATSGGATSGGTGAIATPASAATAPPSLPAPAGSASLTQATAPSSAAAAGASSSSGSDAEPVFGLAARAYSPSTANAGTPSTTVPSNASAPSIPAFYVAPTGSDSASGNAAAPFASLGRAQTAMRSSGIKTTFIRSGIYAAVRLVLTALDSGETWSYFPDDGIDTAVLEGGTTAPNTGTNVITILGGSNITINGLAIQHFRDWGIGIHGGAGDASDGFVNTTASADFDVVTGNLIRAGYTTANSGWGGGGIWAKGQVRQLIVKNNVISDQFGSGIRVDSNGDGSTPDDDISGLSIQNNVLLNTNQATGDNGAIYIQDQNFASTNLSIVNNFIRDYQSTGGLRNSNVPMRDVAIYLDRGASNIQIKGNVIGNTANAIAGADTEDSTQAIFIGSGSNVTISGNIIDLGTAGAICSLVYEHYYSDDPPMTGNSFVSNVLLGNWHGPQKCYALGVGPYGYPSGSLGGHMIAPLTAHNIYYNVGAGSLLTDGNAFGDASPVEGMNPMLSGWTYDVDASSPLLTLGGGFQAPAASWGPLGYAVPAVGTAPSL